MARDLRGNEIHNVRYNGAAPTMHDLVQPASLDLTLNGPAGQVILPDLDNVVLSNVVYAASEPEVLTQYVLIQGQTADGQALPYQISDYAEEVELWNPTTRQSAWGVRLTNPGDFGTVSHDGQSSTFQVYQLDNVLVRGFETWQLRMDVGGGDGPAVPDGGMFRAWVNVSSTPTSTCGILPASNRYDLQVEELDSGSAVVASPGGALVSNVVTVEHPHLIAAEKAGPTTMVAVSGQEIVLGRLAVRADGQDILLTGVHYVAAEMDQALQNTTGWNVWGDLNGDGAVETIVADGFYSNNPLIRHEFVNGGLVIRSETTTLLEFHATVADSLLPDPSLRITTSYISAEVLSTGSELFPDQISVTHTAQTEFTFRDQGDVMASNILTPERQVLGGVESEAVHMAQLTSLYEGSDTRYVGFDVVGQGRSIDVLNVYLAGNPVKVGTATRAGARSGDDFGLTILNQGVVVPENDTRQFYTTAVIKPDYAGGVSGDQFALSVDNIECVGVSSGNLYSSSIPVPLLGATQTVVMSSLKEVKNAGPATAAMPSGVAEVAAFQYVAAANVNSLWGLNQVALDTLTFTVSTLNVDLDMGSFEIYNKANPAASRFVSMVETVSPGEYRLSFRGLAQSDVDCVFESGEAAELGLRVRIFCPNTAVSSGGESSLRVLHLLSDEYFSGFDKDFGTFKPINGAGLHYSAVAGTLYRG
ncbi:MAG: hypothetical protein PHO54_01325 [Candidatus Peribacteraceae bacterium]|nr:hypothetical protein [Candidatus Peribacteraceae bacterium]